MTNTLLHNTLYEEKRPAQASVNGDLGMSGRNVTQHAVTDPDLECALAMATTVLDRAFNPKIAT